MMLLFSHFHQTYFYRFFHCTPHASRFFILQQFSLLSQVGASRHFLINAFCHDKLSHKPDRVLLVYGEDQPAYRKLEQKYTHLELMKGPLPRSLYEKFNAEENNLLILEEQMLAASNSTELGRLFVQGSHHKNLSHFSCSKYF